MTRTELYKIRQNWMHEHWEYERIRYNNFDYTILDEIMTIKRPGRGNNATYNDCIIMIDTETSKETPKKVCKNYIVAWSLSINAFNQNICTLWGQKPSELVECINMIKTHLKGDNTILYCHNFGYDWVFLRKFFIHAWGVPAQQLNVKSHYPLFINFSNGLMFRDSLILAQRSIEKWAKDMNVEHQKAVGKWQYDKVRHQSDTLNDDELDYIECDTLSGVECIRATMDALHKQVYSMPFTATGIPREDIRKAAKENKGRALFEKIAPEFYVQELLELVFHGGFTHANRHIIGVIIDWVKTYCYDLSSSYPFQMLSKKYPMGKFKALNKVVDVKWILDQKENYAFLFKLVLRNPKLKNDDIVMPVLQFSKCTKIINPVTDNGRIIRCDFCEIAMNEIDLALLDAQYDLSGGAAIFDLYYCHKDYLPRWFTDYVYKCYEDKCRLKGQDAVQYAISKAKVNSCYGMTVQKPCKPLINEDYDTGDYIEDEDYDKAAAYDKYIKKFTSVLPYQWGCWVTSYAMQDVHDLGACCKYWWYSDTDSVYGAGWYKTKLKAFNKRQKALLKANGYKPVIVDGVEYCPGVAELDGEYDVFRTLGAKRYATVKDGGLKITIAGVPKKAGAKLLKNDIKNFHKGYIFNFDDPEGLLDKNDKTKLQHTYFMEDCMWTDENGNERGDSIDLSPTTYVLDDVTTMSWDDIFKEEISIQIYDYEEDVKNGV